MNKNLSRAFLARYESEEELQHLKRAICGAYNYCDAHECEGFEKRCILEVAAMTALQDYDCFDADWLQDIEDSTLDEMSEYEILEHAMRWAINW